MIITNFIARLIVKAACWFTHNTKGVTIWPFIFIWPKQYSKQITLLRHEKKHLEQWKRYLVIGFPPIYIYYHLRVGYKNNPLEIEARLAEKI